MIDNLKELFPVEAIGPAIGGALIWFGANYAVIGPEMIGPRLKDKYYAPACERVVAEGRKIRAKEEAALIAQFDQQLDNHAESVRSRLNQGTQNFFGVFGNEGQRFWNKWGGQLGGSIASVTEGQIQAQLQDQRAKFMNLLHAKKAEARSSVVHKDAVSYCGCLIEEALSERFDLAAYTSSLRFYTPPSIRNIETGAIFNRPSSCGSMPVL